MSIDALFLYLSTELSEEHKGVPRFGPYFVYFEKIREALANHLVTETHEELLHVISIAITIHQEDHQAMEEMATKMNLLEDKLKGVEEELQVTKVETEFYKMFGDISCVVLAAIRKMDKDLNIDDAVKMMQVQALEEDPEDEEQVTKLKNLMEKVENTMHLNLLVVHEINTNRCIAVHGGFRPMGADKKRSRFRQIRLMIEEGRIPKEYIEYTVDLNAMLDVAEKRMIK